MFRHQENKLQVTCHLKIEKGNLLSNSKKATRNVLIECSRCYNIVSKDFRYNGNVWEGIHTKIADFVDLRFIPNFSTIPISVKSPIRKIITTGLDFFEKKESQLPLLWQYG